jgi:hypothetical protein
MDFKAGQWWLYYWQKKSFVSSPNQARNYWSNRALSPAINYPTNEDITHFILMSRSRTVRNKPSLPNMPYKACIQKNSPKIKKITLEKHYCI